MTTFSPRTVGVMTCFYCTCPNVNVVKQYKEEESDDVEETTLLHCPWCEAGYLAQIPKERGSVTIEYEKNVPRQDNIPLTLPIQTKRKHLKKKKELPYDK